MAVDAEPLRIDFGPALQEGESPARGQRDQEPVAVARRFDRIEGEGVGGDAAGEVIHLVALRRMGGVERAPIGVETIVDLPVGQRHLVAAPVEGEAGVTALRIGDDIRQVRGLATAVDVHQSRELLRAFRRGIEGRDRGRLALEDAHAVADDLAGDAIDLPRLRHLRFDGFLERIEAAPQLLEILRHLAVLQRRQRFGAEVGQRGQHGRQAKRDKSHRGGQTMSPARRETSGNDQLRLIHPISLLNQRVGLAAAPRRSRSRARISWRPNIVA